MRACDSMASMGPSPFSDGRLSLGMQLTPATCFASMGPSPFSDGRPCITVDIEARRPSFNGAIAFQRWKAGHGLESLLNSMVGFNGAIAFQRWKGVGYCLNLDVPTQPLQWGHRLSAMEGRSSKRARGNSDSLQWGHRLSAMEGW